jgi:hypothetical protein
MFAHIHPSELEAAFRQNFGFHRADWSFIERWIDARCEVCDRGKAWDEAVVFWLTKLRDDLGGDYQVLQSSDALLLCAQPTDTAQRLLGYIEHTKSRLRDALGGLAWDGSPDKIVVLLFEELDDYDHYLAPFLRDGEQPAAGGVCLREGVTHVVVPWVDDFDAANAIVHELTHDCLAHLPLPVWLNEGVAVTLQKALAPLPRALGQSEQDALFAATINWRPPIMWDELAERHFAFWDEDNIQSFWAGTSFHLAGESNALSYSLAEVLVNLLAERRNSMTWRSFLESATWDDAGQTAALDVLGVDLGEVAGTFLGEGAWRPGRLAMTVCWSKAGWKETGSPKP